MTCQKKIIRSERIGEEYIQVDHPSGLTILICPMKEYSTTYALFGTKYGSINTKFKTSEETDYVTVPEGIAHYLEHKLFENEDCDVFSLYAKTGASANAYTSFDKTCYLFSCTDQYEESLRILLNFVQSPYFTKETVEKEQGIIGQEIRMYEDNPAWRVFFNMLQGMYYNHPVRIDIAGTVESIAQIDAPLLYRCYNTFYNLHNMALSISGNVDPDKVIEICDACLKPCENKRLETVFEKEPETVLKKRMIQTLEVSQPLFNIGFKSQPEKGLARVKAEIETNLAVSLLADESSNLYKKMYEEGLINSTFSSEIFDGDNYFCAIFGGESRDPGKVMAELTAALEEAKVSGLDRDRFDMVKKSCYGAQIREFNNVEAVATGMLNAAMDGITPFDIVEVIANVTFEDVQKRLFERLNPEYAVLSIIEPISDNG